MRSRREDDLLEVQRAKDQHSRNKAKAANPANEKQISAKGAAAKLLGEAVP
jgi:hypothetical protein